MNYELAKKLKDAGFIQHGDGRTGYPVGFVIPKITKEGVKKVNEASVYVPTLSELIESCGDDFSMLSKGYNGVNWVCCDYNSDKDIWEEYSNGSTPEEAVANLWLALNSIK